MAVLDPVARVATTAGGRAIEYNACVLATGSFPFVPPIPGTDAAGSFVYKQRFDLRAGRCLDADGARVTVHRVAVVDEHVVVQVRP